MIEINSILSLAFFFLGAVVASFVGVVAGRLHTGQSFVKGRSRCDACARSLSLSSLVPVFSFFVTRGRAVCCGARLSIVSPLTELLLGFLFALAYVQLGLSLTLFFFLLSLLLLLILVLYDLTHQILPPWPLALFVGASALTGLVSAPTVGVWYQSALVALALAGVLAAIHFASRGRAMGFADAPFVLGLGLLVGPAALPGFVFSFWIGGVIGLLILASRPRGSRMGVEVPHAPFLAAGFLLAHFTQWNPFTYIAAFH